MDSCRFSGTDDNGGCPSFASSQSPSSHPPDHSARPSPALRPSPEVPSVVSAACASVGSSGSAALPLPVTVPSSVAPVFGRVADAHRGIHVSSDADPVVAEVSETESPLHCLRSNSELPQAHSISGQPPASSTLTPDEVHAVLMGEASAGPTTRAVPHLVAPRIRLRPLSTTKRSVRLRLVHPSGESTGLPANSGSPASPPCRITLPPMSPVPSSFPESIITDVVFGGTVLTSNPISLRWSHT